MPAGDYGTEYGGFLGLVSRQPAMPRALWGLCAALALLQAACCGGQGVMTWQCIAGTGGGRHYYARLEPPSKQELRERHVRHGLHRFVQGSRCDCADAVCSAARAAHAWCRGKGPECFDELLIHAPRGHVMLRPNPLRFERVDNVLMEDGSFRSFVRNQVLVKVESGEEQLIVTPVGPDAGLAPLPGALTIEVPKSDADVSIDGVSYVCGGTPENWTGLSYEPKPRPRVTPRTR
jgi:hypothetical protein